MPPPIEKNWGESDQLPAETQRGCSMSLRGDPRGATVSGSTFVDSNQLPWRETPFPGVSWKKLFFDTESGDSAVLLRFAAGSQYGGHRHPSGEEYWVLEGELQDGGRSWGPGTFVRHPPGSSHTPSSEAGCLVLVRLFEPIELYSE